MHSQEFLKSLHILRIKKIYILNLKLGSGLLPILNLNSLLSLEDFPTHPFFSSSFSLHPLPLDHKYSEPLYSQYSLQSIHLLASYTQWPKPSYSLFFLQ